MRYVLSSLLAVALMASSAAFGADEPSFELSLKDHQFTPSQLTIPAGKRV